MSNYDDYEYDDSYATCDSVGMGGGCGEDCPVLLRGDCGIEDEMLEHLGVDDIDSIGEEPIVNDSFDNFDRAMDIFK